MLHVIGTSADLAMRLLIDDLSKDYSEIIYTEIPDPYIRRELAPSPYWNKGGVSQIFQ